MGHTSKLSVLMIWSEFGASELSGFSGYSLRPISASELGFARVYKHEFSLESSINLCFLLN
jgi:hypothetical protein